MLLAVPGVLTTLAGCASPQLPRAAASRPVYDTTLPRPVPPRDALERWAYGRGADLALVDRIVDRSTTPQPLDRPAPPPVDWPITRPAASRPAVSPAEPSTPLRIGVAPGVLGNRAADELSAVAEALTRFLQSHGAPAIQLVPMAGAEALAQGLRAGTTDLALGDAFDYLLACHEAPGPDAAPVALLWAQPAGACTLPLPPGSAGPRGASVLLLAAQQGALRTFADLKGKRLAMVAGLSNGAGTFLARQLRDSSHPLDQPFFGSLTLRLYAKDAVLDVLKGKTDAACIDESALAALLALHDLHQALRVLAVSPGYRLDVLFAPAQMDASRQARVEALQRALLRLEDDAGGRQVLWLLDMSGWNVCREGDLAPARRCFEDFLQFRRNPPLDLKPLLNPHAPVNAQSYNRYGDE